MDYDYNKSESRPLSFIDHFATGWMSPAAHMTFKGPFSSNKITNAMLEVRKRNPLLRCIIRDRHILTYSPEESLKMDLPIKIERTSLTKDEQFEKVSHLSYSWLEYNMVPENLWRMAFFFNDHYCDVVFQFHHVILDGMAIYAIIQDFLDALEGKNLEIRALSVPMEEVWPEHANAIKGREPLAVTQWLDIRGRDLQEQDSFTHTAAIIIPGDVISEIKRNCKLNGVTLHGAFMAAYLFGTKNALPKLYTDVSTRRWCRLPLESTYPGVYLGQVTWETSARQEESFWLNARRLLNELQAQLDKGVHIAPQDECSSTAVGPEMLNITNMSGPPFTAGQFTLEYIVGEFPTATSKEMPSFPNVLDIMSCNNSSSLKLCYHKAFWSQQQAAEIIKKIVETLLVEGANITPHEFRVYCHPAM